MNRRKKLSTAGGFALILSLAIAGNASAMHIMEGYLPGGFCVAWGVLCLPFLGAGLRSMRNALKENRRVLPLLAMAGAFIFVFSYLKIPTV